MEFFFLTVGNAPSVIYTRKKGGGELIGSVCFLVCDLVVRWMCRNK